ncbi:MAG TPA: helix-turn-helix domain-containing protein [Acidimicrobiales bacterium]|nr:helix-turn-helix domain-containing protein [Acidimicrobiales bacterium]
MKAEANLPTSTTPARLADALAAADGGQVMADVAAARAGAGAAEVIGQLVLPAVRELRRRARHGEIDPVVLAAGTSLARRALITAGDAAGGPKPGQRNVVVAATDGDGSLEAEGLYESLVAAGHPAQLLVAVTEPDALQRHLTGLRPLAVVAAAADARTLPSIAGLAAVAGRAGIPLLATGPAFGPDGGRAARVGATSFAGDPVAVLAVVARWQAGGGALPMNVEEPAEAALVRAAWPAIVMAAAGTGGPDEAWAQATVRGLGDVLLAAMWAGDAAVLLEWLGDELAGPDRTHVRDVHMIGLLDAVAGALPASMAAAGQMLSAARDDLHQRLLRPGRPARSLTSLADTMPPEPPGGGLAAAVSPGARLAAVPAGPAISAAPVAPAPVPALGSPLAAQVGAAPDAGRVGAGPAGPGGGAAATPGPAAGQAVADLLLLGGLSVQAAAAVVAVPQPGGRWSALANGVDVKEALNDPLLWNAIAARREPLEIADLAAHPELGRSPMAGRPVSMRWAYGTALRAPDGSVVAVYCLLDRWLRQVTRREQKALASGARLLTAQLLALRPSATPSTPDPAGPRGVPERPRRGAPLPEGQQLLRSHEVAQLFDVTERTVINWASAGKLPSLRTMGGHLRFRSEDVHALLTTRRTGS